jgi:hypothetical protein
MSGLAVGVIAGSVIGSLVTSDANRSAANKAADAQKDAANKNNNTQWAMYNQQRADYEPFRKLELEGAQTRLNALNTLYGKLSGGFNDSEAYKFNYGQAMNALNRGALASGVSNNQQGMKIASGLAANEYGNYLNQLAGISGTVSGYQNALSNTGTNTANAVNANTNAYGEAAAQGYLSAGQSQAQLYNALANAGTQGYGYYMTSK